MNLRAFTCMGGVAAIPLLAATPGSPAQAAESASGVYLLGLRGPGAGATPPEGFYFSSQTYIYDGSISGKIPLGDGQIGAHVRLEPLVEVPTFLWVTPVEIAGARLGLSATTPFGRVGVTGALGPLSFNDATTTIADPSFTAFLGWRNGQFNWQAGVTGFAPIGDYHVGEIANVAKHRGALDCYGALTWVEPSLGLDVTNVVGVTFNSPNNVTNYLTGDEFHWEGSVSKKIAEGISIGAVAYFYQQLTDDTGPGAALGPFRGCVAAVGPTVGWDFLVGRTPVSTRLRIYREFEAENRL